jgi:nitrogen fixation/metabolism regulation signal transduction histidine kinase
LLYVAASLIGGLVAVWLAVLITRRLVHEPHEPIESVSEWS